MHRHQQNTQIIRMAIANTAPTEQATSHSAYTQIFTSHPFQFFKSAVLINLCTYIVTGSYCPDNCTSKNLTSILLMLTVPIIHELHFQKKFNHILLLVFTPLDHYLLVDLSWDNITPTFCLPDDDLRNLETFGSFLIFIISFPYIAYSNLNFGQL